MGGEGWGTAVRALHCSANTEPRHGEWEVERGFFSGQEIWLTSGGGCRLRQLRAMRAVQTPFRRVRRARARAAQRCRAQGAEGGLRGGV